MIAARPTDRFALPKCADCGKFHFYPKDVCPHCGSANVAWAEASGRGSVYSFSVVHRAPSPAFKDQVPYVVAMVKTDEGPHLLTRLSEMDLKSIKIGQRVKVQPGHPQFYFVPE